MNDARSQSAGAEPISVRIPEAVRLTGISRSRLDELMKSGDIEFAKVGSSTLLLTDCLMSDRRAVNQQRLGAQCARKPVRICGHFKISALEPSGDARFIPV